MSMPLQTMTEGEEVGDGGRGLIIHVVITVQTVGNFAVADALFQCISKRLDFHGCWLHGWCVHTHATRGDKF